MVNRKVLAIIGTRPEVIKMAPVIVRLRKERYLDVSIIASAQHREMLDQMLAHFQIAADRDFNIMKKNQSLPTLSANLIAPFDHLYREENPDLVLVQGDTTTTFIASLVAFYHQIPVGHIEAGLRTHKKYSPFPEEMNRSLVGSLASLHFAPTELARNNLIFEGIADESIHITGNTVIDAVEMILKKKTALDKRIDPDKRLILVTAHRRENFGRNLDSICKALLKIAESNKDVQIFYAVHPNPNISDRVHELLGGHSQILLSEPLSYAPFLRLMKEAYLILTDSGGIQEEAPSLGVPVLVMREATERMEGCDVGCSKLVGTRTKSIFEAVQELLDDVACQESMIKKVSPFGDGKASERIAKILVKFLEIPSGKSEAAERSRTKQQKGKKETARYL